MSLVAVPAISLGLFEANSRPEGPPRKCLGGLYLRAFMLYCRASAASRAASVAIFAPFCHPALRAVGSLEDVVYNAALGITEASSKMATAMLHRALVW
eukprot:s8178_g1.t1